MDAPSYLSVRVPRDIHTRMKALAAARGEKLQDLMGDLIARFLAEADRRPPDLAEVLRRLRPMEAALRARGLSGLYVFGSLARGEAGPDSDIDLAVELRPDAAISLLDLAHLRAELEAALEWPVELGERSALPPRIAAAAARDFVQAF